MIVCVCRRVSDHQIRRAAAEGAESLACLQMELGVATQCGRCADCAERVLCEARAGQGASTQAGRALPVAIAPIGKPMSAPASRRAAIAAALPVAA